MVRSPLPLSALAVAVSLLSSHAQEPFLRPFRTSSRSEMASLGGFRRMAAPGEVFLARRVPVALDDELPATPQVSLSSSSVKTGGPTVNGSRAVIRRGIAYAPANAPEKVKRAIWAINQIVGRRYKWGGGHGSFVDDGYDCSGTVSYALHHAGLLSSPLGSAELTGFGSRGRGRWITVYARRGHAFAVIAGLRLDTTDFRVGGDVGPRWHYDGRNISDFEARHAAGV